MKNNLVVSFFALLSIFFFACAAHEPSPSGSTPSPVRIQSIAPYCTRHGNSILISGSGFDAIASRDTLVFRSTGSSILVIADSVFGVAAAETLKIRVPAGALSGMVGVRVGSESDTSKSSLVIDTLPIPVVRMLSPTSGSPGTIISIIGSGFVDGAVTVASGATQLAILRVSSDTIFVYAMAGTQGNISVHQGCSNISTGQSITIRPRGITVSSFHPIWGFPGSTIDTIIGTNFGNDTIGVKVFYGGALAAILDVAPTQIIAAVPINAVTARVEVSIFGESVFSVDTFRVFKPRVFKQCKFSASQIPALIKMNGINTGGKDTTVPTLLNFPRYISTVLSSDTLPFTDTLSYRMDVGYKPDTKQTSTVRVVLDSSGSSILWLSFSEDESCSYCGGDVHYMETTHESLMAQGLQLILQANGTSIAVISGAALNAVLRKVNFNFACSDDGRGCKTETFVNLLPLTDSSVVRVELR